MYALVRVVEKLGVLSAWVYAAWLNFSDLIWDVYSAEPGWVSSAALAIGVSTFLLVTAGVVYSKRGWSHVGYPGPSLPKEIKLKHEQGLSVT
jgi:hypothetical protein